MKPLALLITGVALVFCSENSFSLVAQETNPKFKKPIRIKAAGKFIGEKRYYPSPVFHDMNNDGKLDIVTGDLRGNLTIAHQTDTSLEFAAENSLKGSDGKALSFDNW